MSAVVNRNLYWYNATVLRVIDGDTYEMSVDLGFEIAMRVTVRLFGYDTPEMSVDQGKFARKRVINWFESLGDEVLIKTHRDEQDSFGRYLAEVYSPSGLCNLGELLAYEGHAVKYEKE